MAGRSERGSADLQAAVAPGRPPDRPLHGIRGAQRGKNRFTMTPDTTAPQPPDLVDRKFVASRPNQLWLAEHHLRLDVGGLLYVAFILDV